MIGKRLRLAAVAVLALGTPAGATAAPGAGAPGAMPRQVDADGVPWMPRVTDFTLLWWRDGAPYHLTAKGPSPSPILCLQSGTLGIVLDTKSVRFLRVGRFDRAMDMATALEEGAEALERLPTKANELTFTRDGKTFRCAGRGAAPEDRFYFPVRFVESGRYLQRVVIEGLVFAADDGEQLPVNGKLQIALWPDRCSVTLRMDAALDGSEGTLAMRVGDRRTSAPISDRREAVLELFGPDTKAARIVVGDGGRASWDASLGAWVVRLPARPWRNTSGTYYPANELDRIDRWNITLRSDGERGAVAPVMFVPEKAWGITGFTALLCDPDGTPTGLPVQISKNWHSRKDKGRLEHQGPWIHGCAFVRVPPSAERELVFTIAYAQWGGVPAASHAQLCLIGWGHNQFWDEAAVGSFGESICFEPGRVQRRCFITDMRPLMSRSRAGKPWGWAENCGGGDFLMWIDEEGRYQSARATRTDYRAQGPCLTEVRYFEETIGGEITTRADVSLARGDDYLRVFIHLHHRILTPVKWKRLAFFQLGADYYNETPSRRVAVGDVDGLREEWEPPRAKDRYDRRAVPLGGRHAWVSVHGLDRDALRPGAAAASRGLIVRGWKAVLAGRTSKTPHISTYSTEWGRANHKTVVELAPPPGAVQLRPGDYVESDLELVVFPADATAYYGPNDAFRRALGEDADTPRLVFREAAGNALACTPRIGALESTVPVKVAVDAGRAAIAVRGGLGYVPVTFTGLPRYRDYRLHVDDNLLDQSVHGNDFWQTDYDATSRTWRMTYNVPLDGELHTLTFGASSSRPQ